ncbi:MAG: hypothetical protein ACL7AX_11180 [Candidatus Arsenophonus phytopathogenicus]
MLKQSIPRIALAGYEPDPTIKPEPTPKKSPASKQRRRKSVTKASYAKSNPLKQPTTSNVNTKALAPKKSR